MTDILLVYELMVPKDYNILSGFYDAAKCIQNALPKLIEDTIVYPLEFCERHCIEPGLKL